MEEMHLLIQNSKAGDFNAFGRLVHRFQDMAVGYAFSLLGDFHLAEDAAQEAFIEAYKKLPQLRKHEAFPGWLRKIVFKHCDRLARRRWIEVTPLVEEIPAQEPLQSEILEGYEINRLVWQSVQALPEHQRRVTALFYISSYSQKEIADFLDIPVTTVQKRLYDAKLRLKERMLTMVQDHLGANRLSKDDQFAQKVLENAIPHYAKGNKDRIAQQVVKTVLDEYTIEYSDVEFLEHIVNEVYLLHTEDKRGKFVLRIHHPISRVFSGSWQEKEVIESELQWLMALRRDTDMVVEEPVPNQKGDYVTSISMDRVQGSLNCTVLSRPEGHQIWTGDWRIAPLVNTQRELQASTVGALMAQLHLHSEEWNPPEGFARPQYHWDSLRECTDMLKPAVDDGLWSTDDFSVTEEVTQRIKDAMDELGESSENWGLIHAGLDETHYLFKGNEACPIDFTCCGFGHYLYDIAYSLRHLNHDMQLKKAFVSGYQSLRRLPEKYASYIEGFFLACGIREMAFHSSNPAEHKGFIHSKPAAKGGRCRKYLDNVPFVFDLD